MTGITTENSTSPFACLFENQILTPRDIVHNFCRILTEKREAIPLETIRAVLESDKFTGSVLTEIAENLFGMVSWRGMPGVIPEGGTWEASCLSAAMMAKNFARQEEEMRLEQSMHVD